MEKINYIWSDLKMDITGKRVLITGGSGFLGRALAKDLLQKL